MLASPHEESRFESRSQGRPGSNTPKGQDRRSESRTPASRGERRRTPTQTPMTSHSHDERANRTSHKERKGNYSPIQMRSNPLDSYEKPISGRESWWRSTIKETPVPGSYEYEDFMNALGKRCNSYRFKSEGRKRDPQPQIGKGSYLMPGAYEHEDFQQRVHKLPETHGFKNTSRDSRDMMTFGLKDKDINVPPNTYEMSTHMAIDGTKSPSKHWTFKSASARFPTIHFKPKEGPAPGVYEYKTPDALHGVSSSFRSKTPRFMTSHTRVPGPGTYTSTVQQPMPGTILTMARRHGIYFSSSFQA